MSRPMLPALLIVNADDLGLSAGINRAIFAAHEDGIVTSASLMSTGVLFEEAVCELRQHPRLGVGVHLCLHDDEPVSAPGRIPSLVGENGRMLPLGLVIRRVMTGAIKVEHIETEYAAQVARAREAGVDVDHLDSHCHLHAFPPVARAVRRVADHFAIRCIRKPEASGWFDYSSAPVARYPLATAITAFSKLSRALSGRGLLNPDRFVGLVQSGAIDKSWVERAVRSLKPGTLTELMIHPGDGTDPGGASEDHGPMQRKKELEAVTAPEVLAAIRERRVQLVNYRHLATC